MKKLLTIFNHTLTDEQKTDAKENLFVNDFVSLPDDLKKLWMNIPPAGKLPKEILDKISKWILTSAQHGDFVLIQGEFGVSFYLVNFCLTSGFIPVYATTERVSTERMLEDGTMEKVNQFKHVQFRRY